jgi:hypothetical protein
MLKACLRPLHHCDPKQMSFINNMSTYFNSQDMNIFCTMKLPVAIAQSGTFFK